MKEKFLFVFMTVLLLFSVAAISTPSLVFAEDCVIPDSGPWPPCATGGNTVTTTNNQTTGQPCPTSGAWPAGCIPGGSKPQSKPQTSGAGQPCPTSGAWPAGCIPGGNKPQSKPQTSGAGQPCPTSGAWPAGCIPNGGGATSSNEENRPEAAPVRISGSGDDVVMVNRSRQFQMLRIIGNSCDRHFAVVSIDKSLESIDLLVNTVSPYQGVVLIDLKRDDTLAGFEIDASCEWSIEFLPLSAAQSMSKPGTISGSNDDVVAVPSGGIMNIVGNAADRHFAVLAYDSWGNTLDLLVNTIDPYSGTVRVPWGARIIQVDGVGGWTLTYP